MAARLLLLALLAGLLLPAQALAAARAESCGKAGTPGLICTTVEVPVDRSGQTPGTLALHVERLPALGFERGVAFLIAGGPGQGSAGAYDLGSRSSASFLRSFLPGYTLVAVDNRGTGASGVLRCPRLQTDTESSAEREATLAAECAASIGNTRRFYSTRDHAEDLEAVRLVLGVGKVALVGVSYGTKLALAYALAHPDHVERLLLDSVLPTTLPDPFERNVLQAFPGTLAAFCAGGECRAATRDYAGDVVALANRLEQAPIRGTVLVPGGTRKTLRMSGEDLISTVIESDLNPGLAAELPAAVHAARSGQIRPLLRLFDLTARTSRVSPESLSVGLYAATTCADGLFPWTPDTPVAQRPALIDAAIAALPPGALGPFGSWAARTGTATFCKLWPSPAGGAPLGAGPLPDVPVLAVSGGADLRTPTSSAEAVAALFPQGHVLVVPNVGHSVLTSDFSFCSQATVKSWLAGGPVLARCPRVPSLVRPLGPFPPRPRTRAAVATLAVAAKTLHEAEAAWLEVPPTGKLAPVGLYGGTLAAHGRGGFRLVRYSLAPGIWLSGILTVVRGHVPLQFAGSVTVGGPAAAGGTLRVAGRTLSGRLSGRRVSGHL